jgi:hypothetical protein
MSGTFARHDETTRISHKKGFLKASFFKKILFLCEILVVSKEETIWEKNFISN